MSGDLQKSLPLFNEIKSLIDSARGRAAVAVNAELTLLYWQRWELVSAPRSCMVNGPSMASR